MSLHFADRLLAAIDRTHAPACVGLDPLLDRLPPEILKQADLAAADGPATCDAQSGAAAMAAFGKEVIALIAPHVPAVKINIAFFERFHDAGVRVYRELVGAARAAGLIVIGDVKRADIGHSAGQYADAHLGDGAGAAAADAVTVNPYFGFDGVRPFVDIAREQGKGVFVLVQTSNESAFEVQDQALATGEPLCQRVGRMVEEWAVGEDLVGTAGYSAIGGVVSPRDVESTRTLRGLMPHCLFLVPGFGAQGRTADEVASCFKADGTGALVTASRSVIYAYHEERFTRQHGQNWRGCINEACRELVTVIRRVVRA